MILQPEENADIMVGYQKTAIDCLKRGVILGTNTNLETFDGERAAAARGPAGPHGAEGGADESQAAARVAGRGGRGGVRET